MAKPSLIQQQLSDEKKNLVFKTFCSINSSTKPNFFRGKLGRRRIFVIHTRLHCKILFIFYISNNHPTTVNNNSRRRRYYYYISPIPETASSPANCSTVTTHNGFVQPHFATADRVGAARLFQVLSCHFLGG